MLSRTQSCHMIGADLSKLRHRRNNLLALILATEAKMVLPRPEDGMVDSNTAADLASYREEVAEIEEVLRRHGAV